MAYGETNHAFYSEIQRHLLENTVDNGVTWQLHTAAEVHAATNLRISRFVMESGLLRSRGTIAVTAADATYDLASDTITLWRLCWVPTSGGTHTALHKTDPFALDAGRPGWESESGQPDSYFEEPRARLTIQLVPNPSGNGNLETVVTAKPADLGSALNTLPIPALFTPFVKWGVIASLLSKEGEAHDPARAAYAESRFQEGVDLARMMVTGSA